MDGVGGPAQDDPDRRNEERHRQRREDRGEDLGIRRPADHQHEDEPDVVCLPDRAHRSVRVLAEGAALLAARRELPESRAEICTAEDGVGSQADEHQDQWQFR
jgi:hypothetical protein